MKITSQEELDGLRASGRLAAQILHELIERVEVGITTRELDLMAAKMMEDAGAQSAPIVTYNYPGYTCISVNEEIAHGIPGDRVIEDGDVVNVDVSLVLGGFFADNGFTTVVGTADQEVHDLCKATLEARDEAISKIRPGMPLSMLGRVFQKHAKQVGAKIIRNLCSHGVGRALHEQPDQILGYFDRKEKRRFAPHMVLTVEPFLSLGADHTYTAQDEWTLLNTQGGRSAQFEHTIVVRPGGPPEILTRI